MMSLTNAKYLLFYGPRFYPRGGWDDFKGFFLSIEDAKTEVLEVRKSDSYDAEWAQIIDLGIANDTIILEVMQEANGNFEWEVKEKTCE